MKRITMLFALIGTLSITATFAQSVEGPVIGTNKKTNQQVLLVSQLPTAKVTYYERGNIKAYWQDEITVIYIAKSPAETTIWKQRVGHQPERISSVQVSNKLASNN